MAFLDNPKHHRGLATLATRLCRKCPASSREDATAGERLQEQQLLSAQRWRDPERGQCAEFDSSKLADNAGHQAVLDTLPSRNRQVV
jgi:hypothetical protein